MWLWWRGKGQDENFGIEPGQRFRAVGTTSTAWEVYLVAQHPWETAPHVRLHRVGAPQDGKTLSLQVLRDRRMYQPV